MNRQLLLLCTLPFLSFLTTTASSSSKRTRKTFLLNQKNGCVWLQQTQFPCQAELAQWCLSFQSKPSHNHCFKLHVEKNSTRLRNRFNPVTAGTSERAARPGHRGSGGGTGGTQSPAQEGKKEKKKKKRSVFQGVV